MEKLNVLFDSMHVSTVADNLKRLAKDYELTVTITGTITECMAKRKEITALLKPVRVAFMFGVGTNFQDMAKASDATLGYAFKVSNLE